jgi:hypothetical protein
MNSKKKSSKPRFSASTLSALLLEVFALVSAKAREKDAVEERIRCLKSDRDKLALELLEGKSRMDMIKYALNEAKAHETTAQPQTKGKTQRVGKKRKP